MQRFKTFMCALTTIAAVITIAACGGSREGGGSATAADLSGFAIENRVTNSIVSNRLIQLIDENIAPWLGDPILSQAVAAANTRNRGRTLATIKELDERWIATQGSDPQFQPYFNNEASTKLRQIKSASDGLYSEIFLMDNQGCIVSLSDATSDYWQGDEAKFKVSYADGRGYIFIDKVEYDESARVNLVQISLPITEPGSRVVIGAITVGININRIQ